jgi:hypothetical protein
VTSVDFFEVSGADQAALRSFYAGVFGWELAEPQDGYTLVGPGPGGVPGGIWDGSDEVGTYAIFYVQVADVEAAAARAEELGGKVVTQVRPHGPVVIAHLVDPAGNRIGVYRPAG